MSTETQSSSWDCDDWLQFEDHHSDWIARLSRTDPIYRLPIEVIDALVSTETVTRRNRRRVIVEEEEAAERELTQFCGDQYVGVWRRSPVQYSLMQSPHQLTEARQRISDELPQSSGSRPLAERVKLFQHKALAYAGWLTLHSEAETYREERDQLHEQYDQLDNKPFLPQCSLPFLLHMQKNADESMTSQPEFYFARDLATFFSKWELSGMATWELPFPQQALLGVPLEEVAMFVGTDVFVDYYPTYLEPDSAENLREQIRVRQATIAKITGTGQNHPLQRLGPRGSSTSQLETVFRMWLIESSVTRRYGDRRGLAICLSEAFEDVFEINAATVRKYRQQYSPR